MLGDLIDEDIGMGVDIGRDEILILKVGDSPDVGRSGNVDLRGVGGTVGEGGKRSIGCITDGCARGFGGDFQIEGGVVKPSVEAKVCVLNDSRCACSIGGAGGGRFEEDQGASSARKSV